MRSDFIVNADTINKMIQFGTVKYGIVKQLKDRTRSDREIASEPEENGTSMPCSPIVECSKSSSPTIHLATNTITPSAARANTTTSSFFNNNSDSINNNNHSIDSDHKFNHNNREAANRLIVKNNSSIEVATTAEMLDTLPTSYTELDKINSKTPSPALADQNRIADQPPSSLMAGDDDDNNATNTTTTSITTRAASASPIMTGAAASADIDIDSISNRATNAMASESEVSGRIQTDDLSVNNIDNSNNDSNKNNISKNNSDSLEEMHKTNNSDEKHPIDMAIESDRLDHESGEKCPNSSNEASIVPTQQDKRTDMNNRSSRVTSRCASPQPSQQALPHDFPQFPGGGPVTLEAIQNMQMAIAQFAAKTFANGGSEAPNEAAMKQLAFLQQTLFNLQQQQLFQIQLIQQLQSQLALNQISKSQNVSEQDQDEERDQIDDEDRDRDARNEDLPNGRSSVNLTKTPNEAVESGKKPANDDDRLSEDEEDFRRNKHKLRNDSVHMDEDDDDDDDIDDSLIEFKKFRPDEPLEYGEIRLPYRPDDKYFSKDNTPLPYGGQDENQPLPYGSDLASTIITNHDNPPSLNEPNSLEMLQKRAQEVLDSASAGILSGNLADEFAFGKDKNGDKNRNEPFFKHRCRYCGKVFGSDSALQIHIRSHTGERPFKCNVCGSRFTTKGNLKVHFQRHAQKFPHVPMNSTPIPEHLDKFHPPLLDQMSPDSSPTHQPSQMPSHIPNVPVSLPLAFPPGAGFSGLPSMYRPPLDILKSLGPYANPFFSGLPPMPPPPGAQSQSQQQSEQQRPPPPAERTSPITVPKPTEKSPSPSKKEAPTPPLTKAENNSSPKDLRKSTSPQKSELPPHKEEKEAEISLPKENPFAIKIKEEKRDSDEEEENLPMPQPKRPRSRTPSMSPRAPQIPPPQAIPSLPQRSPNQPLLAMPPHHSADLPMGSAHLPPSLMTREELFEHHHRMQMSFRGSPDRGSPIRSPAGIPGLQRSPFLGPMKHEMALLPRPHSNDNSWENFIEVSNTSETMKLKELMKNKKLTDPNQCVVCDRVLSCKSALQMHYRTHTGERPFKCRICGRAFTTKGNLKTHMAVHKIRPPMRNFHQCPVCHKKYSNALVLQQHIRLHTGEPTDLTPEQISAAEIRDFPPSMMPGGLFNPFNPFNFGMSGPHNGHMGSESSLGELDDNIDCSDDFDDDIDEEHMSNGGDSDRPKSSEEIKGMLFEQKLKIGSSLTNKSETSNASPPHSPISVLKGASPAPSDVSQGALDLTPRSTSLTNNSHPTPSKPQISPIATPAAANPPKIERPASSESLQRPPSQPKSHHELFQEQQHQRDLQLQQHFHNIHQQHQAHLQQQHLQHQQAQHHQQQLQQSQHSPQQTHLPLPPHQQPPPPMPPHMMPQRPPFGMFPNLPLFPPGMGQTTNMCSAMNTIAQSVMPAAPFNPLALSGVRGSTTCGICFKTFPCHSALEIHYRSHTKERPFKCNICDRGFTTKGNLKQHMLTHKIRDMEQDAFRNRAVKFEYMRGMKEDYE